MSIEAGVSVRVLAPFDEAFPGTYTVERTELADDGQPVVYLVGVESAFAPENLELAE